VRLADALDHQDPSVRAAAGIQIHRFGERLGGILKRDPRFPGEAVRTVRGEGGAQGFYPSFAGPALVRRLLRASSPSDAIEWLQKVLRTTAADGKSITAIWDVAVDQEVELTQDVRLVPIVSLPEGPQKRWITSASYNSLNGLFPSTFHSKRQISALVAARRVEPYTYDPSWCTPGMSIPRVPRRLAVRK
jgi:hypothetical protein